MSLTRSGPRSSGHSSITRCRKPRPSCSLTRTCSANLTSWHPSRSSVPRVGRRLVAAMNDPGASPSPSPLPQGRLLVLRDRGRPHRSGCSSPTPHLAPIPVSPCSGCYFAVGCTDVPRFAQNSRQISHRAGVDREPMGSTAVVRIGARGSRLSRAQVEEVRLLLLGAWPGITVEVEIFVTTGDIQLETPLPLMGGKGVFTSEIETALREGRIDFAVHSLKDLPVANPDGIVIGAVPERAPVTDVLVSRSGRGFHELSPNPVIGTSS